MPELRKLLITRDLKRIFGRTDRTIRTWVIKGYLHPIKVGRSVFFRREDVEALMKTEGLFEDENNGN